MCPDLSSILATATPNEVETTLMPTAFDAEGREPASQDPAEDRRDITEPLFIPRDHDGWLTAAEAARYLRLGNASSIRSAVSRGALRPDGKAGKAFLYRKETLDAFAVWNLARSPYAPLNISDRHAGRRLAPKPGGLVDRHSTSTATTSTEDPYAPPPGYKPNIEAIRRALGQADRRSSPKGSAGRRTS
jgi:hypothetical protein